MSQTPRSSSRRPVLTAAVSVAVLSTGSAYLAMVQFGIDVLAMSAGTAYTTAGVFELSLVTVALLAREAAKDNRPGGTLLTLTWALSSASGAFAAWHEIFIGHPLGAAIFRFLVPLLAALMWHLALIGDRHLATGISWSGLRQARRMHALFLTTEDLFRAQTLLDGSRSARHRLTRADTARRRARSVALRTVPPTEMRAQVAAWRDALTAVGDGTAELAHLYVADRSRLTAMMNEATEALAIESAAIHASARTVDVVSVDDVSTKSPSTETEATETVSTIVSPETTRPVSVDTHPVDVVSEGAVSTESPSTESPSTESPSTETEGTETVSAITSPETETETVKSLGAASTASPSSHGAVSADDTGETVYGDISADEVSSSTETVSVDTSLPNTTETTMTRRPSTPSTRKVTAAEVAEIFARRAAGQMPEDIARDLGLGRSTVYKKLRGGVHTPGSGIPRADLAMAGLASSTETGD